MDFGLRLGLGEKERRGLENGLVVLISKQTKTHLDSTQLSSARASPGPERIKVSPPNGSNKKLLTILIARKRKGKSE